MPSPVLAPPRALALLLPSILSLWASGCCESDYTLNVDLATAGIRADEVAVVELALVDECPAPGMEADAAAAASARSEWRPSMPAPALGKVPPGSHALLAIARDADCALVAAGCAPIEVKSCGAGVLSVTLARAEAGGACADGARCVAGICTPDDGCGDADGDGSDRCPLGGRPADCDDDDPDVFPEASEQCNGVDDNCDGRVDEGIDGASLCPEGSMCRGDRGCALNDGSQCAGRDPECDSLVCTEAQALIRGAAPGFMCTRSCCRDADCPADEICWDGGQGARSCLPPSFVATMIGAGGSGDRCSVDADCRSGVCAEDASGCVAACASDESCSPGLSCAPKLVGSGPTGDHVELACVASSNRPAGEACFLRSDCAIGFCLDLGSGGVCSNACRIPADCHVGGSKCASFDAAGDGTGWVTICQAKQASGAGAQDDPCAADADCDQERCWAGKCADACCTSDQCTDGNVCTPILTIDHWEMRCIAPREVYTP